jgi:hypothetical protein
MNLSISKNCWFAVLQRFCAGLAVLCFTLSFCALAAFAQAPPTPPAPQNPDIPNAQPRGKKLFLTDGSFHMVRSYERKGDRVLY